MCISNKFESDADGCWSGPQFENHFFSLFVEAELTGLCPRTGMGRIHVLESERARLKSKYPYL